MKIFGHRKPIGGGRDAHAIMQPAPQQFCRRAPACCVGAGSCNLTRQRQQFLGPDLVKRTGTLNPCRKAFLAERARPELFWAQCSAGRLPCWSLSYVRWSRSDAFRCRGRLDLLEFGVLNLLDFPLQDSARVARCRSISCRASFRRASATAANRSTRSIISMLLWVSKQLIGDQVINAFAIGCKLLVDLLNGIRSLPRRPKPSHALFPASPGRGFQPCQN